MIDRLGHWAMAVCVLLLMGTSFLPIVGFEFGWVTIHWVTGIVLIVAVIAHIVRSLIAKSLASIWLGKDDLRDVFSTVKWSFRWSSAMPNKPGKYSAAQKIIHHSFALAILTTTLTGALMLAKIDTPWWERNPYLISDSTWGLVYALHDLAALMLITMVICHVYFALRPEKWLYTRSMVLGWITRREYESRHDARRWQVEKR